VKKKLDWKRIYATNLKLGLSKVIKGIDYSRIVEYPLAFSQLEFGKNDLILDVGSSDSVFPVFLASLGHTVHAIDIDSKVLKLERYANELKILNLTVAIQDITKLLYPDNFFDKITVISAIEHVLPVEDGDVRAIGEIARTLRAGGQAIVTVPCSDEFEVKESRSKTGRNFSLIRRYDKTAMRERLVKPSGLYLANQIFFGESVEFSKIWYKTPFSAFSFPAPIFARLFMHFGDIKKPQGVCLKLRKHNGEGF